MDPGRVADEFFEEHGSRYCAAVAGGAGVHDVGNLALDLFAVVVGAGQTPEFFAGHGQRVQKAFGYPIVVGEEACVELAERDADGPGERGGVDEVSCAKRFRIVQAVGENKAPLGVGVDDFDSFSGHGGDDVAGFEGLAIWHIFRGTDDSEHAHGGLQLGNGAHGGDHGSGAGHVVLHLVHVLGGLNGDATGVEGNAFSDEPEHWTIGLRVARFVADDDQRGWFSGALRDGGERAHFQFHDFFCRVNFALQPKLGAHGGGTLA